MVISDSWLHKMRKWDIQLLTDVSPIEYLWQKKKIDFESHQAQQSRDLQEIHREHRNINILNYFTVMQLKKNQTLRNLSIRERSWLFQKKNFQKKKLIFMIFIWFLICIKYYKALWNTWGSSNTRYLFILNIALMLI